MAVSGAALVASVLPIKLMASTPDLISGITGGAEASDAGINLTAPEIAENGNTVPISIDAPGAVAITVLAAGNPTPGVAKFKFWSGFRLSKLHNPY
jgi:Predicted secreted protein